MSEFDKLIFAVMCFVCLIGAGVGLVFLTAMWRAYRDSQITKEKFLAAVLFVILALLVPVIILFVFYPRPIEEWL